MRLSAIPSDPHHLPSHLCRGVRIFMGGVQLTLVRTADEEGRYIERLVTDERGRIQIDRATGEVRTERLYGDVRIEMPDKLRQWCELLWGKGKGQRPTAAAAPAQEPPGA